MFLLIGTDTNGDGISDAWGMGSGFMQGPDVMATAGHNMWSDNYGWISELRVFKNQNSSTISSTYYYPLSWTLSTAYTNNLDYNFDWAVVTLQNNLGDSTGWFGKGWSSGSLNGKSIIVSGYPGDKSYYQYKSSGTISFTDSYNIKYSADTMGGQSGSPVYDSNNIVWGIHTYGGATINQGNKITEDLYNILQDAYLKGMEKWH